MSNDKVKQTLIYKLIDKTSSMDSSEMIEIFDLDIHDLIDNAIREKLEKETIEQLVDRL